MANHHHNGGRESSPPEDNRTSWRPQDLSPHAQSYRRHDDLDDRPWRDRYRDDDRRASDRDRDPRRWEGSRGSELGYHEDRDGGSRATERCGRGGYWLDRGGFEPDHYPTRGAYDGARGFSGRDIEPERGGRGARYEERMGYHNSLGGPQATQPVGHAAAHTHRGTGPHRGKGPVGYQRSDERLREMVCESLADDDQIDASQIEVTVRNGEVMLSGVVEDRRTKRNAEDCAYSVSGVRDVQNLLRVKDDERTRSNPSSATGVGNDIETQHHDRKYRA